MEKISPIISNFYYRSKIFIDRLESTDIYKRENIIFSHTEEKKEKFEKLQSILRKKGFYLKLDTYKNDPDFILVNF